LTAVAVPSATFEAARDLARAREQVRLDLMRCRHRLSTGSETLVRGLSRPVRFSIRHALAPAMSASPSSITTGRVGVAWAFSKTAAFVVACGQRMAGRRPRSSSGCCTRGARRSSRAACTSLVAARMPTREAETLRRMSQAEAGHRERLEGRMRELGIEVPAPASVRMSLWRRLQARIARVDRLLAAVEAAEDEVVDILYQQATGDSATDALLSDLREEERSHSNAIKELRGVPAPQTPAPAPAPSPSPGAGARTGKAIRAGPALPVVSLPVVSKPLAVHRLRGVARPRGSGRQVALSVCAVRVSVRRCWWVVIVWCARDRPFAVGHDLQGKDVPLG